MNLPTEYAWLLKEPAPKMLITALKYYGLKEGAGSVDNPTIMKWAHDFGIDWYTHDSIAWCSLFLGEVAKESSYTPPNKNELLAAVSWSKWGNPHAPAQLGSIMVFNRPGGHHVGLYVGEDDTAYHILGGNTGDAVGFARLLKSRLISTRWPADEPIEQNIRVIQLSDSGTLSQNEA